MVAVTLKPEPGDFQRVKLQGRWSVVLLHSPTWSQQSAATTQPVGCTCEQVASPMNLHTILLWEERDKRTHEMWANMAEMRYILNVRGGKWFWIWIVWLIRNKKWHFSPLRDHVYQRTGSIFEEKGKCLLHTLKQKYRHYFLTSSRPWHALHCLLWICSFDSPTTRFSTKEDFFAFCSFYQIQTLFFILLHTYILYFMFKSICSDTSWKTRHLVFSHRTSERDIQSLTAPQKSYMWYNLQKIILKNSNFDLFSPIQC